MENFTYESVKNHFEELKEANYLFKTDITNYLKDACEEHGEVVEEDDDFSFKVIEFNEPIMLEALVDDSCGEERNLVEFYKVALYDDGWVTLKNDVDTDYSLDDVELFDLMDVADAVKESI